MNYIRVDVTALIPVKNEDLPAYEATDIDEATANQREWFEDGLTPLGELIDGCVTKVTFTTVKDAT